MFKLSRRTFIGSAMLAPIAPKLGMAAQFSLLAEPVSLQILSEGQAATELLGFNGSSPGPELRARQGDTVFVRFENKLDMPSSLHWHGIRLDNAMDGVPGLTQPLVQPGETFDYAFRVRDAGTFWYHSHHQSWEQVARGLYGPLIVEEPNPPQVDADITVTLDDWRLDDAGALMDGFGNRHDFSHAGRLGNNAMILPSRDRERLGDRVRLRLINAATARIFPIRIEGLNAKVVALDGMPLATPRDLSDIKLAPAQRVDIIGDVTAQLDFLFVARDALYNMGSLSVAGENPNPSTAEISALPAPRMSQPTRGSAPTLTLRMEGGAMGGRHSGDDVWAFNGMSGLQDTPFAIFKQGDAMVIDLINDTSFPHGIHLHGHHFHELNDDGSFGDLRDTSLVEPGTSRKIHVVFDNPGKWLLHCHMLGHQASGMKTWVHVI